MKDTQGVFNLDIQFNLLNIRHIEKIAQEGCLDSNCRMLKREQIKGMRTNGGCKCVREIYKLVAEDIRVRIK